MFQICSNIANFPCSAYFGGHFCHHINTWAIVLINEWEENAEKES